jgi:hypothetical protein
MSMKHTLVMIYLLIVVHFFYMHNAITASNCSFNKLTLLTQPIGDSNRAIGGHYGLVRSFLNGLTKIGVNFNYNPLTMDDVGDVVYVLADINALRQAIDLKKQGKIKRLLSWRYLVTKSDEDKDLLVSPEVDLFITNSEWRKNHYVENEPSLKNRLQICYAGIDINFLNPASDKPHTKNVLVYWKTEPESFCEQVEQILRNHSWNPIRIHYGSYKLHQYKEILTNVAFAVFISRYESQGIALAEAWAMDIPTIVWDPQEPLFIWDKLVTTISAAPYLNESVGCKWKNIVELEQILQDLPNTLKLFSPRDWALKNMTDEVAAQLLIKIIENNQES